MSELERTITRLESLRDLFAYWLRWNKSERDAENLASTDDTHIMVVPPQWPTRGSIQAWVDTIDSAILPLRTRLDPPPESSRLLIEAEAMLCDTRAGDAANDLSKRILQHLAALRAPAGEPGCTCESGVNWSHAKYCALSNPQPAATAGEQPHHTRTGSMSVREALQSMSVERCPACNGEISAKRRLMRAGVAYCSEDCRRYPNGRSPATKGAGL
jgi:hypothetical protein